LTEHTQQVFLNSTMNHLLSIPLHSQVSLITNSSSEIFVCNDKRSLEKFKSVLLALVQIHNAKYDLAHADDWHESHNYYTRIDESTLFTEIFKEPRICPINFNIYDFPGRGEYFQTFNPDHNSDLSHPLKEKCEKSLKKKLANSEIWSINASNLKTGTNEHYNYWKTYYQLRNDALAPWEAHCARVEADLIEWALKENGIDMPRPVNNHYASFRLDENHPHKEVLEHIYSAINYDYSLTKGHILLESADDNSCPGTLFQDIEDMFNAERRHLG